MRTKTIVGRRRNGVNCYDLPERRNDVDLYDFPEQRRKRRRDRSRARKTRGAIAKITFQTFAACLFVAVVMSRSSSISDVVGPRAASDNVKIVAAETQAPQTDETPVASLSLVSLASAAKGTNEDGMIKKITVGDLDRLVEKATSQYDGATKLLQTRVAPKINRAEESQPTPKKERVARANAV